MACHMRTHAKMKSEPDIANKKKTDSESIATLAGTTLAAKNSALVAIGREGDISRSSQIGRYSPESDRLLRCREMTRWAIFCLTHRGKSSERITVNSVADLRVGV